MDMRNTLFRICCALARYPWWLELEILEAVLQNKGAMGLRVIPSSSELPGSKTMELIVISENSDSHSSNPYSSSNGIILLSSRNFFYASCVLNFRISA